MIPQTKTRTSQVHQEGEIWTLGQVLPGSVFRWGGDSGGSPEVVGIVPRTTGIRYGGRKVPPYLPEYEGEEGHRLVIFFTCADGWVARFMRTGETVQIATEAELVATFEGGP